MQLEIQDIIFTILPNSAVTSIKIHKISGENITLKVPSQLPHLELIESLKSNIDYYKKSISTISATQNANFISIFQKEYAVVYNTEISSTYIAKNIVYTNIKHTNSISKSDLLREKILHNHIMYQLSLWEERFNTLLYDIGIRLLKSNYFTFSNKNKTITYNRKLIDYSIDFVNYIISISVFNQMNIDENLKVDFLNKYVKDWKMSSKIELYERSK